jgi:hypothetical protein
MSLPMSRSDALRLLGLPEAASDSQIDSAIASEYRTWSSRTNAPNFDARTEAQRRLNDLARAETVLLGQRQGRDSSRATGPTSTPFPPPPRPNPPSSQSYNPPPPSYSPPPPTYTPHQAYTDPVNYYLTPQKSKAAGGILGILLGALGVHRFYLGYSGVGTMMLLMTVLSFGILGPIVWLWGFIEGCIILGGGMRDRWGRELI